MDHIDKLLEKVRACKDEREMFEYLKGDRPGVALEIAKSKYATPRILENLTRYPAITVRHEVAKNPQTSRSTLERLGQDKDMLVRDYARRTLTNLLRLQEKVSEI